MFNEISTFQDYPNFKTNLALAQTFWCEQLLDQDLITIPQNPKCQISVVVPVHNEDQNLLLRQLQSIINQQDIESDEFEIIYTVNNSPTAKPAVVEKNLEVLHLPIWRNRIDQLDPESYPHYLKTVLKDLKRFNLFVIDKSSSGNEIPDCNVGKARNRGIAEASLRFHANNKNGLIFQLDADSHYPDPTFFRRAIDRFTNNPLLAAICGGVRLYCDSQNYTPEQKSQAIFDVPLLCEYLKWKSLKFLLLGKSFVYDDDFMSGPNMITKSFTTASVGGVPHVENSEDDVLFGKRVQSHTEKYGLQYSFDGAKEEFIVDSLLRLSGGLTNNIGNNIRTFDSRLDAANNNDHLIFTEPPNVASFTKTLKDTLIVTDPYDVFFSDWAALVFPLLDRNFSLDPARFRNPFECFAFTLYEVMYVEPIPNLYARFRRLALLDARDRFSKAITRFEEKVELNEQFLLQQLDHT